MTVDIVLNRYPPHLRGFVQSRVEHNEWGVRAHATYRYWGVINVDTGVVVAKDSTCCSLSDAVDHCALMVIAARGAWIWELEQEQLQRSRGLGQSWELTRKHS